MTRRATLQDAPGIARVHVQTWKVAYDGIVPRAHLDGLSGEARTLRWRDNLSNPLGVTLVAESGGQVVGWLSYGKSRDEGADGVGEIYGIYVHPDSWNQGFGRQLMQDAEQALWLEKYRSITLWVFELNARSRRFYEHSGYSADGTRKTVSIGGQELVELLYAKK